ncbi:amino acid transporter [Actinorhabdospora filicis]|uniref:Amino acid transporter n=1 Tax=Actinorhabdospora filicis TaxID=1785913 RepID=A0A9W6SHH7_9ACTN|nr:amino acid transporter [Actinorhabdospora filicis]GLZ76080.1 amino acid transporter [Actinorhabdospora filicis]
MATKEAAGFRAWLYKGWDRSSGPHAVQAHKPHKWWRVMCLTGVDYFSTLGYQPGIAALAAGMLSPIATLVLVALTLFGALPIYRRVAAESPRGEGSIAMLERLLPWWAGKLFVLVLLGFLATDFMITITLSAADATAHVTENPFAPSWLHGQEVVITLVLIAGLAAVFLKGFAEAIGVAVVLVTTYLTLNLVVVGSAVWHVITEPVKVTNWWDVLTTEHSSPWMMIALALLVFPKLALGLSGFETGVTVMPQIKGGPNDTESKPLGRIRGTKKLLTTAAVIMSVFLILSSFATTVLIPHAEFEKGGEANGRALAYLAHEYYGDAFGTVYDISTIAILWFAGASAMAGLLNVVPRYLPRYGMAPEWTRAVRPLVLVFTTIAVLVTVWFKADVDAQGGAYATGVLVLMLSASFAATLAVRRRRKRKTMYLFGVITLVFAYTTVTNIVERPEGVKIAGLFILGILIVSFMSRLRRSFELRASRVLLDPMAKKLIVEATRDGVIRVIANEPHERDSAEYTEKEMSQRSDTHIPADDPVLFLEVTLQDSSDFTTELLVTGERRYGHRVLKVTSPAVANTIAAVLLHLRDHTGALPHVYFNWTEGNPIVHLAKFFLIGDGEIAPVTREVLRRAEKDLSRRPHVHVG